MAKTKKVIQPQTQVPLNLRDRKLFPLVFELYNPYSSKHSRLLLEITHCFDAPRAAYLAQDQLGSPCLINFRFKQSKKAVDTLKAIEEGKVLVIKNPEALPPVVKIALLGGMRLGRDPTEVILYDVGDVEILSCSLDQLLQFSDSLQIRHDPSHHQSICTSCGVTTSKACKHCATLFCSKACLQEVMPPHQLSCKSLQMIMLWKAPGV